MTKNLHQNPNKMESSGTLNGGTNMTSKQTFFSTTSYTCTKYSSTDVADGCQLKTKYSSKCLFNGGGGGSPRECTSDVVISESRIQLTPSPKSFIQQRVERLYGPGALAQGFFIQSPRKLDLSEKTLPKTPVSVGSSNSTSSLPVLRHLRPEFRAQLPILSPKRLVENGTHLKETMELKKSKGFADLVHKKEVGDLSCPVGGQDDVIEFLPAAAQVILPVTVNGNGFDNGIEEKKDGHHFLKVLKLETVRIIKLAEKVEAELDGNEDLNEEALGYLRSASGKARLLVNQKMQQFEGLCHKNINEVAGEQFPTTAEDLQGFWDMVMLQVNQIDELFNNLETLKANNWVVIEEKNLSETKPRGKLIAKRAIPTTKTANSELQRTKREAQRKLMLEQRRKAMLEKKNNNKMDENVEIFVAETS